MSNTENRSIFLRVVGDTPKLRIIDFLLTHQMLDYSLTDIARGAGVNYQTLLKLWGSVEKLGLVKETRKIGKATLFILNKENPMTKELSRMQLRIVDSYYENFYPNGKAHRKPSSKNKSFSLKPEMIS